MTYVSVSCDTGKFTGIQKNKINFFYGIPYAKKLTKETQWLPPEKLNSEIIFQAVKEAVAHRKQFIKNLS